MEPDILYRRVRKKRGADLVFIKAMEEMGELIKAISKFLGNEGVESELFEHMQEEIADVSVMVDQLRAMCFSGDVDRIKAEKLARLETRLLQWEKEE